MKRRNLILSSGSVIGGGLLGYSQITAKPTVGLTADVNTPSSQIVPEGSDIEFTFESFQITGQNIPSGTSITASYGLYLSSNNNKVSSKSVQIDDNLSGSFNTTSGNILLPIGKSNLSAGKTTMFYV